MNSKTLEKIVRWGIYAMALIPLVVFKEFLSPFHFGKIVVFRSAIEILAIFYIALILQERSYLPRPSRLFWAVTIFMAVFGLTSLTGINPYQSFIGTLERMGGWFSFLHFWMFFVIMIGVLRTREDWMTLIKVSVFAGLLSSFYGFLQKGDYEWVVGSGERARIFGTLGNTALFAGYIIVNMFFALYLVFESAGLMRWVYGAIALVNVIAIFMTAVRGSLLGVIVGLFVFVILYFLGRVGNRSLGYVFLFLVVAAIFGELLLIANRNSPFVSESSYLRRIADVSANTQTVQTRFWAWRAGVDGWNDSTKTILLGWGPENFNIPFSKHFNPKFYVNSGSETLFDRAHNMFVEVLVTMGALGIISYIAIFVMLFWTLALHFRSSPDRRASTSALIAGLVAYIIHNCFIFDTSANFIVFFILIGVVYDLGRPATISQVSTQALPSTLRNSAVILAIVIVVISIYKTNILPAKANYAATRGIVASWAGDHKTAVQKFQQALAYDTFPAYELRHRYVQYVLENISKIASTKELNAGEVVFGAIEEVKKNLSYKDDYLPYLYISRAYLILGKEDPKSSYNDLAIENSLKALEISPTFIRTYYEVAQAYLNQENYAKAIEYFEKAVDLNPATPMSWWYLGITQLEVGDTAGGLQNIQKAFELRYSFSENDLLRLINPYSQLKRFNDVAMVLERLVSMSPNNPNYRARLAATYAQLGKINEAVIQAKEAARLDPSFEAEARQFVSSIGGTW